MGVATRSRRLSRFGDDNPMGWQRTGAASMACRDQRNDHRSETRSRLLPWLRDSLPRFPHRRRFRQIASAASRHGLGYLAGPVGLGRLVRFERGWFGHDRRDHPYTRPEHVRLALEDLGATFVKLGQILSTRGDLLPVRYQTELARLQDAAPPVPTAVILEAISTELRCDAGSVFATFELQPLASASIGQAHAATLADGSDVVVKVRRPGVVAQVEEDLEILACLTARAARRSKTAFRYDLPGLAAQFAETLRAELDYLQEGRNAERFAANFADDESVHIPKVHWEATTSQVLTLERLWGAKVSDASAVDALGLDRAQVAQRAASISLRMVFEHGFFHADPHPGNFFIEPDGSVGLIDFGMVGSVDDATRQHLSALLTGFALGDGDALVDNVLILGAGDAGVDRSRLRRDLLTLAAEQRERPLGDVSLGSLLGEILAVVRRHHLVLPTDLALLVKTIAMCEGVGAQIDPSFRLISVIVPFLARASRPAVGTPGPPGHTTMGHA